MLLALAPIPASARTLAELEKALARQPPQSTSFVEYRFSRLLKRAAISKGTLEYRQAGVWVRTVESPRLERAEITNDEVRLRRGQGEERKLSLARAPQLRMLLDSLEALLEGRITRLGDEFDVTLDSRGSSWGLRFRPQDASLLRKIARIDIFGTDDAPHCIEMAEPDGDAAFTLLGGAGSQTPLPDRAAVEALCRVAPIDTAAR